jgi:hypothetical protein
LPPGIVEAPWAQRVEKMRMRPKKAYLMPVA